MQLDAIVGVDGVWRTVETAEMFVSVGILAAQGTSDHVTLGRETHGGTSRRYADRHADPSGGSPQ
jgi:hypothetical protein